jgi:hypothetical protein
LQTRKSKLGSIFQPWGGSKTNLSSNRLKVTFTKPSTAARVRRATINEGVFCVDTVVDCRYLEINIVREREGSLNGSEVEGGAMRDGVCRKILRSGAALEAIVRRGSARSVRRCTV